MRNALFLVNAALLVAYPIAWFTPLFAIGIMEEIKLDWRIFGQEIPPLFGLDQVSVITTVQTVWADDIYLAILITFFALVAPMIKVVGLLLMQLNLLSWRLKDFTYFLGKLAMADVFLVALGCVLVKGIDLGQLKILWGTYFFSTCIIISIFVSLLSTIQRS